MRRQLETLDDLLVPGARCRVDELCRRRVRVLGRGAAGQQRIDEIRNEQQARGVLGNSLCRVRIKLKDRVEIEKLNPGAGKELFTWDSLADLAHYARGTFITVTDGVFQQDSPGIDQPVINAPAINPYTLHGPSELLCPLACGTQSRLDLAEDVRQVPAQMPRETARRVMKSPDFLEQQFSRRYAREKDSSTTSTEIDCDVQRIIHIDCGMRNEEH